MVVLIKKNYAILAAVTALIILLVASGLWLLSSQKSKGVSVPPPTVAPRILDEKSSDIKKALTKTDKKSGDMVLENNNEFKIVYLIYNDEFMTFILKAPFEEIKGKAEAWFKNKGFSASDLCLLRLGFYAPKEIMPTSSAQDVIPTGCPVPKTASK